MDLVVSVRRYAYPTLLGSCDLRNQRHYASKDRGEQPGANESLSMHATSFSDTAAYCDFQALLVRREVNR